MTDSDWRRTAAGKPPEWTGDLNDDCTAHWAGFMMRAEWMNGSVWWWSVTDESSGDEVASSNNPGAETPRSGAAARSAAEAAARRFLGLQAT